MAEYAAKSIIELRKIAKDRGVKSPTTLTKLELIRALEAQDAEGVPHDFADMPDEIIPAPESEPEAQPDVDEEPAAEDVIEPETAPEEPVIKSYKLMNDIYYNRPDGVGGKLKAGRVVSAIGYNLDRIRANGGVLAPIIEK